MEKVGGGLVLRYQANHRPPAPVAYQYLRDMSWTRTTPARSLTCSPTSTRLGASATSENSTAPGAGMSATGPLLGS